MSSSALFTDRRLAALSAGNFIVGTSLYIVGGLLNELAAAFEVSIAKAGLLIAVFAVTSVIAAPVFATLGARLDRRVLLAGVLLVCAVANLLAALATSYGQLMATRVLAAVTSAVFTPQAAATLGLLVPESRRSAAISAVMLGWGLASVLGLPLGIWLGHAWGWRAAFGALALMSLIAAWAVWRELPAGLRVGAIRLAGWIKVLRTPALTLLLATSFVFAAGNHCVFSYIAPMVAALHPAQPQVLSLLLLTHGVAAIASNMLAVLLMQRLGLERLSLWWGLMPVAVFLLWPPGAGILPLLFALQFVWGLGASGFNGLQQSRLLAVAPTLAAASIALNSSAFYLGQAAGTLLGGGLWEIVGARYLPWAGLVLLLAAAQVSRRGRQAAARLREQGGFVAP